MRRPAAVLFTVAATFAATAAVGLAQSPPAGGGPNQTVNVDNANAGTVLARAGVQVARAGGQNASPSNLAHANAHDCATPCQAIAAAFQIVLVPKNVPVQAPQNVALATNIQCAGCGAFAYAYQYVVTVARNTTLDASARAQITAVGREADQDVHAGLDYPTLDGRLHLLAQRLRAAVDDGLTRHGVGESNKRSSQDVKEGPNT